MPLIDSWVYYALISVGVTEKPLRELVSSFRRGVTDENVFWDSGQEFVDAFNRAVARIQVTILPNEVKTNPGRFSVVQLSIFIMSLFLSLSVSMYLRLCPSLHFPVSFSFTTSRYLSFVPF